jgi:hypothetical protein
MQTGIQRNEKLNIPYTSTIVVAVELAVRWGIQVCTRLSSETAREQTSGET